jgi:hypothetical protein
MFSLFNIWILPSNHSRIKKKLNSQVPPHVPLAINIERDLLPAYKDMFEETTRITNIGHTIKFMSKPSGGNVLARDCRIFGDFEGSLILHEVQGDIDTEDFLRMFPETAKMPSIQEDMDGILLYSRRSSEYPFEYELFEPLEFV